MRKFLCLLLVGLLAVGALAGCSSPVRVVYKKDREMLIEFVVPKEMNGATSFEMWQYSSENKDDPNYWRLDAQLYDTQWGQKDFVFEGDVLRFACYSNAVYLEMIYKIDIDSEEKSIIIKL